MRTGLFLMTFIISLKIIKLRFYDILFVYDIFNAVPVRWFTWIKSSIETRTIMKQKKKAYDLIE